MPDLTKVVLDEGFIPTHWYNILPDLPEPLPPPIHPGKKAPVVPEDLSPIFPRALIEQEMSTERFIPIPKEVRSIYRLWRPTPLYRAWRLEKALGTTARLYYKYEGVSPPGSHKPNTAVAQAFYNKQEGVRRLTTETGAGQWGSALAFACQLFGLECTVYMVKISYEQKPYRRVMMETWGAQLIPSPSQKTNAGRNILAQDPENPGSLGIAISEAVEDAATHPDTKYSLGSVLNHVLLHQTVIGEECLSQFEAIGDYPDIVIGCVGGGSSFSGISFPFIRERLTKGKKTRFIAVEPEACPSITRGVYTYDFGDTAQTTPLIKMFTLGHTFIPPRIHAGGLRYHGMAPLVSLLCSVGIMEARAVHQREVFRTAVEFARAEGIIPAPEPAHAIAVVFQEAQRAKEAGESPAILFNLCGHGHFDMQAYDEFLSGRLQDYAYPKEEVKKAISLLPRV